MRNRDRFPGVPGELFELSEAANKEEYRVPDFISRRLSHWDFFIAASQGLRDASVRMFFLVTGASGVGKTSVRKLIGAEIAGKVAICELGTLGITPEWSLRWRHQAVEQVVQLAIKHQESGKHFLLCGDPVPPGELYAAPSAVELAGVQVCLLDASPERQTERLTLRGDPAELIPHHIAFAEWMRHHVVDHRYRPEVIINQGWEQMRWHVWNSDQITVVPWNSHIIDTNELKPIEVARQVVSWIKLHIRD